MKCSMDGYNVIAISGIDGSFSDFTNTIESSIAVNDCLKISYDRSLTFLQNIEVMRSIISRTNNKCCLIGWSIGAVAAAFLADSENVDSVVMINPFYKRSEVLKLRNIYCDEEVRIENTTKQPVNYVIITGVQDDKIPYTESLNVAKHYNLGNDNLHLIENAKHGLDSFPSGVIQEIINKVLL